MLTAGHGKRLLGKDQKLASFETFEGDSAFLLVIGTVYFLEMDALRILFNIGETVIFDLLDELFVCILGFLFIFVSETELNAVSDIEKKAEKIVNIIKIVKRPAFTLSIVFN